MKLNFRQVCMFWGSMDVLYLANYLWQSIAEGRIPLIDDIFSFNQLYTEQGGGYWLILIFNLNPMTPIIKIYRQIIYYGQVPELGSLALALIIGIVFIVVGEVLFKKLQRGFAEEF